MLRLFFVVIIVGVGVFVYILVSIHIVLSSGKKNDHLTIPKVTVDFLVVYDVVVVVVDVVVVVVVVLIIVYVVVVVVTVHIVFSCCHRMFSSIYWRQPLNLRGMGLRVNKSVFELWL